MARLLQHLYGQFQLSTPRTHSAVDDAFGFVYKCDPGHFFDFLELTFKTECLRRVIVDRNELVDAINEIFRVEDAPYQLTPVVTEHEEHMAAECTSIPLRCQRLSGRRMR